nr:tetratricopeptide repeat protein [Ardenticatenales bacterium]
MAEKSADKGNKAFDRGEYETAVAAFSETREVWRQLGDTRGEASALVDLGVAHQKMGNLADAQEAYEEGLRLYEQLGDDEGRATVMG